MDRYWKEVLQVSTYNAHFKLKLTEENQLDIVNDVTQMRHKDIPVFV